MPICLNPYFIAISARKQSMPYTFFSEIDSGYNQAIGWKYAFYLSDSQIQIYSAVSSGGYCIIRSEIQQRSTERLDSSMPYVFVRVIISLSLLFALCSFLITGDLISNIGVILLFPIILISSIAPEFIRTSS